MNWAHTASGTQVQATPYPHKAVDLLYEGQPIQFYTPEAQISSTPLPYSNRHLFSCSPTVASTTAPQETPTLGVFPSHHTEVPTASHKRKFLDKENLPPDSGFKRPRKAPQTKAEKLETVWRAIKSTNWTFGEFLFHVFRWKDEDGKTISRPRSVAIAVESFLGGGGSYGVGEILESWMTTPDGRCPDSERLYNLDIHYSGIKQVQEALTSFAVQITKTKLVQEAEAAVKPDAGLHVATKPSRTGGDNLPLTWNILRAIAARPPRKRNGVVAIRKTRPVDVVCTHIISALDFSRNRKANRLPTARGILYFSLSAPVDLFAYESRTGSMVAYNTAYEMLRGLAKQEEHDMKQRGRLHWGGVHIDNTQNYLRMRDMRIGRENKMTVGIAGTWVEHPFYEATETDLEDRRIRRAGNLRSKLTVEKLLECIDPPHLEEVGMLQWLNALVSNVPALGEYKEHISLLYKTRVAKHCLPRKPSNIHPLATSGKNETITTELKDGLTDFMEQVGHTPEDYIRRPLVILGDGLTYQKVLEIKRYLQATHEDEFERFDIVEPLLQAWHTMWTDVSRIFQAFWGGDVSYDPSTLGHSARKIGQPTPSNLGKVDYYPSIAFMYLILDARMLDAWQAVLKQKDLNQYFEELKNRKALPAAEELEAIARSLYRAYSTTHGAYCALHNIDDPEWRKVVPQGSPWLGVIVDDPMNPSTNKDSGKAKTATTRSKKKTKSTKKDADLPTTESSPPPFTGDHVLYRNILLMRDAIFSREALLVSTSGDPERWWEIFKVWLFTFSGSTHRKYTSYVLESIVTLEFESSPTLKRALLGMMFVSMNGSDFLPGDLLQEHFNRLLEFISERKGKSFTEGFMRNVVSRNLYEMSRIKKDLRDGIGLGQHSARHSEPHFEPEKKVLRRVYLFHELSYCRSGQIIDNGDPDEFSSGIDKLIAKVKNLSTDSHIPAASSETDAEAIDEVVLPTNQSFATVQNIDGNLVFDYTAAAEALEHALAEMEADDAENDEERNGIVDC